MTVPGSRGSSGTGEPTAGPTAAPMEPTEPTEPGCPGSPSCRTQGVCQHKVPGERFLNTGFWGIHAFLGALRQTLSTSPQTPRATFPHTIISVQPGAGPGGSGSGQGPSPALESPAGPEMWDIRGPEVRLAPPRLWPLPVTVTPHPLSTWSLT